MDYLPLYSDREVDELIKDLWRICKRRGVKAYILNMPYRSFDQELKLEGMVIFFLDTPGGCSIQPMVEDENIVDKKFPSIWKKFETNIIIEGEGEVVIAKGDKALDDAVEDNAQNEIALRTVCIKWVKAGESIHRDCFSIWAEKQGVEKWMTKTVVYNYLKYTLFPEGEVTKDGRKYILAKKR